MRFLPALLVALLAAGCGVARSQKKSAAETSTARVVISWSGDESVAGTIDLRHDAGVVDARGPDPSTVLTLAEYEKLLEAECERAKKQGRENEVAHCASCSAGEGEV